jgi:hypothetical protein
VTKLPTQCPEFVTKFQFLGYPNIIIRGKTSS